MKAERRRFLEASPLREFVPLDLLNWEDRLGSAVAALVPGEAEVIYDNPGERAPSQNALIGLQRLFR